MITAFDAGRLNVTVYQTRQEMGQQAAKEAAQALREVLAAKDECNVIFAAAPSQNDFLAALCEEDIEWGRVNAFHMDEYIGLSDAAPQRFGNFLKNAVFDRVPFKSISYIQGNAADIDEEIARYSDLLRRNPVDIVFMGIGENGHIAFNDPHIAHFDAICSMQKVELDERCRQQQVNDGCFATLNDVPRFALTLTVPVLMSAKRVFCIVPCKTKAEAVQKTVYGEIRETLPASILRTHPCARLYLDADSAEFILK